LAEQAAGVGAAEGMDMMLGIDVSHYTEARNWQDLADHGIRFAFVKATEGATVTDNLFDRHWQGLHDAGVPCGAYHYAHPGSDPATQAAHFHAVVGDLRAKDLQPVLDLEVGDGQPAGNVLDWTLKFAQEAEARFQAQLIIYTGGFWRNQLGNPASPALGTRRLWTARYGGQPIPPQPWSTWSIWQFSDGLHSAPPEAAVLKCNCDWDRLADGLSVDDLTVAANPLSKASGPVQPVAPVPWPGRFFTFPATPPVSGDDVRQWQAQMGKRGWTLNANGVYDADSRTACVSLQRQDGLVVDGIVGSKTWQATFVV
jgi:lysozyme